MASFICRPWEKWAKDFIAAASRSPSRQLKMPKPCVKRGTLPWGITERDGNFQILGYRRHPDGWREDPQQKVDLPVGSTVDDAINRMIAILREAARK
jgi:hypothetical protein